MSIQVIDKVEAFTKLDYEISTPLDKTVHNFQFTRKWFQHRNQTTFSTFMPATVEGNDKPLRMIQIGVFEGMDLIWMLQNCLKHPDSFVLAIDPWAATRKIPAETMDAVMERAEHNLKPWRKKLHIERGYSGDILRTAMNQPIRNVPMGFWDHVTIDGDHNAQAVYDDAVHSFWMVRLGGTILFDDVRNRVSKKHHVAAGLQKFLDEYDGRVERIWSHRYMECFRRVR